MLNTTQAGLQAYRRMDQQFRALQAIRDLLEARQSADAHVDYTLYSEWEEACRQFRRAHEEWRAVAWFPAKPPTEPLTDLRAIEWA